MCIGLIQISSDSAVPLVVLHNRDEYRNRLAEPSQLHSNGLMHGVDCKEGGTWFAADLNGNFAFVTNIFTGANREDGLLSRGIIIPELLRLTSIEKKKAYVLSLTHQFNPFNVIFGSINEVFYYNNLDRSLVHLGEGVHVIVPSRLGEPMYKSNRLKDLFLSKKLNYWELLSDDTPPEEVSRSLLKKFSLEMASKLECIRVSSDIYGTRCSSFLEIDHAGHGCFQERSFDSEFKIIHEWEHRFEINEA